MQQAQILIRYGELGLKSSYVRKTFEHALQHHIKQAMEYHSLDCSIRKTQGRFFVSTIDTKQALSILQKIMGITSLSLVYETTSNLNDIAQLAFKLVKNKLVDTCSFAVRVNRAGQHEYTSQQAAAEIGQYLVDQTHAPVDLNHPDIELEVDIRGEQSYVFLGRFPGMGGLPYDTQGAVLVLIENMDSLLGLWYVVRRGCKPVILSIAFNEEKLKSFCNYWNIYDYIYFNMPKYNIKEIVTYSEQYSCTAIVIGEASIKEAVGRIQKLKQYVSLPVFTPLIGLSALQLSSKREQLGGL